MITDVHRKAMVVVVAVLAVAFGSFVASSAVATPKAEAYTVYVSGLVGNGVEKYSGNTGWNWNRRNKAAGYGYCLSEIYGNGVHASYKCSTAEFDEINDEFWGIHNASCKNTSGGYINVNCWIAY